MRNLLQVWNLREGDAAVTVARLALRVRPLAISDDRKTLPALVGDGSSNELVRWNVNDGSEIDRKQLPQGVPGACALNADGSWLAISHGPKEVLVCHRTDDGKDVEFQTVPLSGAALAIHDGRGWLGVGRIDGTATIWDLNQNRPIIELNGLGAPVRALTFDTSGRRLAVVTDRDVRLCDLSLDYVRVVYPVVDACDAVFDAEGSRLIAPSRQGQTQVFNAVFESLIVDFGQWLKQLAATMNPKEFETAIQAKLPREEKFNGKVVLTGDGRLRAISSSTAMQKESGAGVTQERQDENAGPRVENVQTSEVLHTFGGLEKDQICIAVSPDARFAATGSWDRDQRMGDVRLWDLPTGTELRRFIGHVHYANSVAFSPDSLRLLSGGKGTLHLWDVETASEIRRLLVPMAFVQRVTFSPDGRLAVASQIVQSGPGRRNIMYDLETGEELLEYPETYPEIAFAPRDVLCDTRFGSLQRPALPAGSTPGSGSGGAPRASSVSAAVEAARVKAERAAAVSEAFVKAYAPRLPEGEWQE